MKLLIVVVLALALIASASAMPQWDTDASGHAQAALGFATGVVAVPVLGLGGEYSFTHHFI